jgi:hypothetical protein
LIGAAHAADPGARHCAAVELNLFHPHPDHQHKQDIEGPDAASLATVARFGFAEVGEQWDEEDGRELIFERPARDPA